MWCLCLVQYINVSFHDTFAFLRTISGVFIPLPCTSLWTKASVKCKCTVNVNVCVCVCVCACVCMCVCVCVWACGSVCDPFLFLFVLVCMLALSQQPAFCVRRQIILATGLFFGPSVFS